MKNIGKILLILLIPIGTFAQNSELAIFDNLVAKIWKAGGSWGDGSKFKQEIQIDYSLNSTIVVVKSVGFKHKAQTELG